MSYPINYPTPQNADVQIFSIGGSTSDWVKPQGCSFVYFTLVGGGGNGAGGTTSVGGGSGASGVITNCLVPSFLVPDVLRVYVGQGGGGNTTANRTRVEYQQRAGTAYELLSAQTSPNATTSSGGTGGASFTSNYFTAMGFLNSLSGQTGVAAGTATYNASQPFSAGAGGANALNTAGGSFNPLYDYPDIAGGAPAPAQNGNSGYSVFSNLVLSCGGTGGAGGRTTPSEAGGNGGNGAFGSGGGGGGRCGSGTSNGGRGGDGLVVIISW